MTSSRTTPQNSRTLAFTCVVSRPHLIDQAGIIGQPASAKSQPARSVHVGPSALEDTIRLVFGRAHNHVAQHVE